jgi:N-acetylmuramic acid 6-phosphate etherase
MVNVQPRNSKLRDRATRIIVASTELGYESASELLSEAGGSVPVAIVMARMSLDRGAAEARVAAAGGRISEVVGKEALNK